MDAALMRRFIAENVPARCTLGSAMIEFCAQQRGLPVERFASTTILVRLPTGAIPFEGIHGPDSSGVGRFLSTGRNGLRYLAALRGLPMDEPSAEEDHTVGERHHVFVLDGQLVSATLVAPATVADITERDLVDLARSEGAGTLNVVDVTDTVDASLVELAIEAAALIPGLPHVGVQIATRTGERSVSRLHYELPLLAHFPTHGQARDAVGAIIDYYLDSPRWAAARRTDHVLAAERAWVDPTSPTIRPAAR